MFAMLGFDLKLLDLQPESQLTELANNIGVVAKYKVIFSLGLNLFILYRLRSKISAHLTQARFLLRED